MRRTSLLFVLLILLVSFSACSRPRNTDPVVVHVFADTNAREVTDAVLAAGNASLVTPDNRPIVISIQAPRTYQEGLATLGEQSHPDVVILNAMNDSKQIDPTLLSAVRATHGQYFIGVPKWSDRENKNAVEQVAAELRKALEKQSGN